MKRCRVDGCDGPVVARGWCNPHYLRWKTHGDPLGGRATMWRAPRAWLEAQIEVGDRDACWLWPYGRNASGYGRLRWGGEARLAHRVARELDGRPIPPHLQARHRCPGGPNRACVNPDHVEPGTAKQNGADSVEDGTSNRGSRNGRHVLTEAAVMDIHRRLLEGEPPRTIALRFGVSADAVRCIQRGATWGWLTGRSLERR